MSTTAQKAPETTEEERPRSKVKLLLVGVLVLAVVGGAAWFLFLKPSGGSTPPAEPGEILSLEPTQINLADGHYLRLGLALQLTTTAHEADGSKALDAAIHLFSGKRLEQLEGARRDGLKQKLAKDLEELYHGDVMDVYFTEFVTQ